MPGVTLQRMVEKSGPLPVPLACDVIRQTALGLQHAIEQGMVHRDIKPSNLMLILGPKGAIPAQPLVKLVDMGVARLYEAARSARGFTDHPCPRPHGSVTALPITSRRSSSRTPTTPNGPTSTALVAPFTSCSAARCLSRADPIQKLDRQAPAHRAVGRSSSGRRFRPASRPGTTLDGQAPG